MIDEDTEEDTDEVDQFEKIEKINIAEPELIETMDLDEEDENHISIILIF